MKRLLAVFLGGLGGGLGVSAYVKRLRGKGSGQAAVDLGPSPADELRERLAAAKAAAASAPETVGEDVQQEVAEVAEPTALPTFTVPEPEPEPEPQAPLVDTPTPADELGLDARRRDVHERARRALDELK